jgi:glyoxylase I family protein
MQLQGIHHVSINVKDVEEARKFYVDLLGMEVLPRPDLGFPGMWLRSGGQELHLLGINAGKPLEGQHFAFLVPDVAAVVSELSAAGLACSSAKEMSGVCWQAFTHDPSGNMIEFNQRL